jgi:hypothetical protein
MKGNRITESGDWDFGNIFVESWFCLSQPLWCRKAERERKKSRRNWKRRVEGGGGGRGGGGGITLVPLLADLHSTFCLFLLPASPLN